MMSNTNEQVVCPYCLVANRVPVERFGDSPSCGKCKKPLLSATPVNANDKNFQRFIEKSSLPVIVDFWAPWCGPCLQFAPVFEQVCSEMSGKLVFLKLDT